MSKVKVAAFSISLDGFGAGPGQDLNDPLGIRGHELHSWLFKTDTFKKMTGKSGRLGFVHCITAPRDDALYVIIRRM